MDIEPALVAPPPRPAVLKVKPIDTTSLVIPSAPVTELLQVQKDAARSAISREAPLVVDPTPQTAVFPSSTTASAASRPSTSLSRRTVSASRVLEGPPSRFGQGLHIYHSEFPVEAKAATSTEPQRPVDPRKRKAMEAAAAAEARVAEREARKKVETRLKEAELKYQERMSELDWAFMSVHKVMRVDLETLAGTLETSFEASRARSKSPAPALGLQIDAPALVVDANATSYVNEDRLREMESCFLGKLEELKNTSCEAFSTLDDNRMLLAETFDDKFERLASVFVKPVDLEEHKKVVDELERHVESLANQVGVAVLSNGEMDKVGARVTDLERSRATELTESERRYAAMEREWRAFDPFEKGVGEAIDVNDTKLKNMDSNLTLKTEYLETAVENRITELESTYSTQIDTMGKTIEKKHVAFESTTDERFSSLETSVDTRFKASKTRVEEMVKGVETTFSSRVDSTESSLLGKLEALQASMNQKFLDMQASHALQLDNLQGQIATLAEENQGLRKNLDEEHQARLAAQADAEKVAQELREKVATIEQDTPKMREELGKMGQSLEVCAVDILDLQSKYQRVSSDADNYHFLRSSMHRSLAEVEGRSRGPGGASTGAGPSLSPRSGPQWANQAGSPTNGPKVEGQTGL
ncbi:hypothetical protein FRC01_006950 [Tulasnella sp. 417]|nr:hypothetical protein FRC01_006950 [Tulasnella sp. 417]